MFSVRNRITGYEACWFATGDDRLDRALILKPSESARSVCGRLQYVQPRHDGDLPSLVFPERRALKSELHQVHVRGDASHIGGSAFELNQLPQGFGREVRPMKRLMISALVSVALFAATTAMQRSPSVEPFTSVAANSSSAPSDCAAAQPTW